MKPLNEWSFSDFKRQINRVFNRHGIFFSLTRDAYYMQYSPAYPEKTAADILVCLCFATPTPRITLYGNTENDHTPCTIKQYSDFKDLLCDLKNAD